MNNFDGRNLMVRGSLGNYVELIKRKNKDLITDTLVGVDINKNLITKQLIEKYRNLGTLKVVEKGCFIMNGIHVARDKKIPVSLHMGNKPVVTSNAYYVFKIKNSELMTEYLNLLFKATEIDRMGLYLSEKDIRGKLKWKDFIKLPIYVPPPETQQRIVNRYESLEKIIQLKKEINDKLEKWMQSLFYVLYDKSEKFTSETFGDLFQIVKGGRPPRSNEYLDKLYFCKDEGIPWLQVNDISKKKCKFIYESSEQLTREGFKKSKCDILGGGTYYSSIMLKKNKLKT